MNKSAFLKLIQQASNISDQQHDELEKVAAAFPYCQTAHLLLAKSAYDKGSMLSTQRLRRASSYATDRQLLKRIIYTAPVPEPVFAEPDTFSEEVEQDLVLAEQEITEISQEIELAQEPEILDLSDALQTEETIEEVYALEVSPVELVETEAYEANTPEDELDSELALLFTFNSISSSSTDLLSSREQDELDFGTDHLAELEEALHEIEYQDEQQDTEVADVAPEAAALAIATKSEEEADASTEAEETAAPQQEDEEEIAGLFAEEDTIITKPEDAEINYTLDEIDRLYAEDALGYWMGSSRMGEVLQLKDDYTRQRPQSFHPELILEYSKTHELEKAIQPDTNVLSHQLDIIDQFLKLNPRLKTMANLKLKSEPQEDLSLKSSKIKKGMASENLANIYLKQGKTKKAVKIYEQLILKYPEKKSYFAEQIEKLQNIT
jgi:hypothetical protein